jgi:hypothetical protein
MSAKIDFDSQQISEIVKLYSEGISLRGIGEIFGVSKLPISKIIKEKNMLRKGKSNGVKIILSNEQVDYLQNLYVDQKLSPTKISEITEFNVHFLRKFFYSQEYKRNRSQSTSISRIGTKLSDKTKQKIKEKNLEAIKKGIKKQTGGFCEYFEIEGLSCQGTYEKFYIEKLKELGYTLPKNGNPKKTPFGFYTPDFEYEDYCIEVKSSYTYDVLLGKKKSWYKQTIDETQLKKIKWVNKNLKKVQVILIDKRNKTMQIKPF